MLLKLTLLFASVAAISAETTVRSAPYPAAGWRPQKPFNLPAEYLPPLVAEQQQAQQPQKFDFEISKERVDFAGQIQGNTLLTANQPQTTYLPPDDKFNQNDDFLQVQGLPTLGRPLFLSKQEIFQRPVPQRGDQAQLNPRPQPQFLKPLQQNLRPQPNLAPQAQQQFMPHTIISSTISSKPAQQYGAPNSGSRQISIVYPDPSNIQNNDEHYHTAIEALNVAVDSFNRGQLKKNAEPADDGIDDNADDVDGNENSMKSGYPYSSTSAHFQQGQYYVLGPDNALQRVMYTTSQDEQEVKTNGFTAQLKYTPAGEIRDPVFKYNERGQLVRLLKK